MELNLHRLVRKDGRALYAEFTTNSGRCVRAALGETDGSYASISQMARVRGLKPIRIGTDYFVDRSEISALIHRFEREFKKRYPELHAETTDQTRRELIKGLQRTLPRLTRRSS